jgi:hypothetical protein
MELKGEKNFFTSGLKNYGSKKAQVTIFIIIAIILVAATAAFLIFRSSFGAEKIPSNLEPAYNNFLYCLEEETLVGADILESQAGYIELPDFESGSAYMPFSSQLNFLGNPIPYWYYVSGNNIQKEQVPTKSEMEEQLAHFIEDKISTCVFDDYYEQGFKIYLEEGKAKVDISDKEITVNLDMDLKIEKGDENVLVASHKVSVNSELGSLYDSAREVYEKEQDELFLEDYAVDTLRLYAPVDGVELTCSPEVWNADDIFDQLKEAIEANTLALKTKAGDYSLTKEENKYFVLNIDQDVRFINSQNWANSFEVLPSEGNLLLAQPVGNQQGLGALGFCYVPYHFVYNVKYPVLVQVYSSDEFFQFPVAVIIQGNKPREPLDANAVGFGEPELCKYKNTKIDVNTYDTKYNPVDSRISYECLGTTCEIGETVDGKLSANFPQCVNGYIIASSDGFEEAKYLYSTTAPGSADIFLNNLYERDVNLKLDGSNYNGETIINFVSEDSSRTIVYPEQRSVELSEGQYEVNVYIYKNSSLKLGATTHEQCFDVPKSGLGGFFGLTEQKCFEMEIPAQIISNSLAGGGKQNYYILDSDLKNSVMIEINAESLPVPATIEELQENYVLFENKGLNIVFK